MPPPEDFLDEGENGECCFCGQNGRSRYKLIFSLNPASIATTRNVIQLVLRSFGCKIII